VRFLFVKKICLENNHKFIIKAIPKMNKYYADVHMKKHIAQLVGKN